MSASHYTDTLQQVRAMVDALQAARQSILIDRDALAECCRLPSGELDADSESFVVGYDSLLEQIDAALMPLIPTGSPAPLCELIRWHRASGAERPAALITVLLKLTPDGGSVECGWWDGEQWMLCESGGAAVQADVRAWAEVWGPAL